jgi:hypothetical protein
LCRYGGSNGSRLRVRSLDYERARLSLVAYEAAGNLSEGTTKSGLKVKALMNTTSYEPGQKIADDEMRALWLKPHALHGDWINTLAPRETGRDHIS